MSKSIYILGGMGPQASVYFYQKVIELAASEYGATNNNDYPEINIHSVPVPDFISSVSKKAEAMGMLTERVKLIDSAYYGSFAMVCNTAHLLAEELKKHTEVEFVSMVDEVINNVTKKRESATKVGLMATPTTLSTGLYQKPLEALGFKVLFPTKSEQAVLEEAVRQVLAGEISKATQFNVQSIGEELLSRGAEHLILGCTELPIVYADEDDRIISSTKVLARSLLEKYYQKE